MTTNTATVVTNNTGFNQTVKSKKVTTTKSYDENGKLYSEETVEEYEYVVTSPQPYYDPFKPLGGRWWETGPVYWSAATTDGIWEHDGSE